MDSKYISKEKLQDLLMHQWDVSCKRKRGTKDCNFFEVSNWKNRVAIYGYYENDVQFGTSQA